MNRGAMRTQVEEIVEDTSNIAFSDAKIDRALNRSARHIHSIVQRQSAINYGRATTTFSATSALTYNLTSVTDIKQPIFLRRTDTDGTGGLGRGFVFGEAISEYARLIPESQREHPDFAGGYDGEGRIVAFFMYDGSEASPWTVNFLVTPSGTWELVYETTFTEIATGTGNDTTSFTTIPEQWHDVVVYRAAVSLLGIHNDSQSPIVQEFSTLYAEMERCLSLGKSTGQVRQEACFGGEW